MTFQLTKNMRMLMLLSITLSMTQMPSYAGFSDLFKDDAEAESFKSSQASKKAEDDASSTSVKDEDDVRLSPKRVRSAVHELFHDEFSEEDVDKKLANARKTIDKGEKMMQACGDDHSKADYKKGKVLKEVGEKQIADIKSKGSFQMNPNLAPEPSSGKHEKPDSL